MRQNFQSLLMAALVALAIVGAVGTYAFMHAPVRAPQPLGTSTASPTSSEAVRVATGTATMLFVGDIMPSRFVATKMKKYGFDYPFRDVAALIRDADIAFGNLEAPIVAGREIAPYEMTFRGDPEFVPELAKAGFDIVTLANNHTPNFGEEGLLSTFRILAASGIRHAGAGTTSSAYSPVVLSANGIKVAFVAQNETDVVPSSYCADDSRIGTACFDLDKVAEGVERAQREADIVVFTMHAGHEYHKEPNERQRTFAYAAIDAGADIVIGHHPHVIQTKETHKGRPIYYSLGNFIFDQDLSPEVRRGLVVVTTIDRAAKKIVAIEEIEVAIEDYARPVILNSDMR